MRSLARYPVVAAMACAGAFTAVLIGAYRWSAAAHLDASALNEFIALRNPLSAGIAEVMLVSVDLGVAICFVGLLCAHRFGWGEKRRALTALGVLVGANVTAQILKMVLAHPRIDPVLGTDQIGSTAFPSGHATAAMSIAVVWVLMTPRPRRGIAAAWSILYVSAVSLSLFILAWHFPSDVLGGMLVATGFGFAGLAVLRVTVTGASARAPSLPRAGAFEEWAAGGLALAFAGALAFGVLLVRGGDLVGYARAHTAATVTGMVVVALGASLLAALTVTHD